MRRCSAYLGLVAMLVALLTAPLFHMHERDEHGHAVSFVHAHLIEFEAPDLHASPGIEGEHSHAHARWVDVFIFDGFSFGLSWPVDVAITLSIPRLDRQRSLMMAALPQAHGPPGALPSSPRSPPSV